MDRFAAALDWFIGSDPGLLRLMTAAQAVVTIGLTLLFEGLFVRWTGALEARAPAGRQQPAVVATISAQHHGVLLIALLLGAVMGLGVALMGGLDKSLRAEVATYALMPVALWAALAALLPVAGNRPAIFASMTALVGTGVYLRRFGPRYATLGILLWAGSFMSYFFHGQLRESQLGWVAAELAIGTAVAILVRSTLFRPHQERVVRRLKRSSAARARQVMRLSARRFSAGDTARRSQIALDRAFLRLNENILMIDARLAGMTATKAAELARAAYDVELALSQVVHVTTRLAAVQLDDADRSRIASVLAALSAGDVTTAEEIVTSGQGCETDSQSPEHEELLSRFACAVTGLLDSLRSERRALGAATGSFKAPAPLIGGWLPGSAIVSGQASMSSGPGWAGRVRLAPYLRSSIQIMAAVGIAIVLGDIVSPQRFYWSMIAAFTAFMAGNNAAENSWRGLLRIAGTALGIFAAFALAGVIGGQAAGWNVAVVLIALFIGIYLNRISYLFMTFGITIAISRLYAEFGEYSSHLLYQRLELTAIGGSVAVAVALLVLPLRSAKVLRTGLDSYRGSLTRLLAALREHLNDLGAQPSLRDEIRDLDAQYQAAQAIGAPFKPVHRTSRQEAAALDALTRTHVGVRALAAEVERIEAAFFRGRGSAGCFCCRDA